MAFKFNPLSGQFDIVQDVAAINWMPSVATEGDLPSSGNVDGDARTVQSTDSVYVWDGTSSRWVRQTIQLTTVGASPNSSAQSIITDDSTVNIRTNRLQLQPADGSNPGIVSTTTQTFAGNKTFSGSISASNLSGTNTGDVTLTTVGSSPNVNGASLSGQQLELQPADGSNPGVITAGTQTIGGNKTYNGFIYADGGLDVNSTVGTDTLNIGTTNAEVINIGNSGTSVNLYGDTFYQNVTNLNVKDKLITVNKDGAAASGFNSGIEVEENSVITGYVETSSDRNSWELKAPNTAGVAVITPGVSGIIINQSSHDPLTLGTFGTSPNTNGASLSTQQLTLQPADATNPGGVSTTTQTFAGNKTFNNNVVIAGSTTIATSITGPLRADSGLISTSSINLTSEVSNILPIANGGTNLSTTPTNGQLLIGNGTNYTLATLSAGSGISITNGSGSISVAMSVPSSTGDITQTSFTALDNQSSPQNVTGFAFANGSVRSFDAQVSITRDSTYAVYSLMGIQRASDWVMSQDLTGDTTGITFSITSSGQIQYQSTSTGNNATLKFRAEITNI